MCLDFAFWYFIISLFLSLACRLTAVTQLAHHGMLYVPLGPCTIPFVLSSYTIFESPSCVLL